MRRSPCARCRYIKGYLSTIPRYCCNKLRNVSFTCGFIKNTSGLASGRTRSRPVRDWRNSFLGNSQVLLPGCLQAAPRRPLVGGNRVGLTSIGSPPCSNDLQAMWLEGRLASPGANQLDGSYQEISRVEAFSMPLLQSALLSSRPQAIGSFANAPTRRWHQIERLDENSDRPPRSPSSAPLHPSYILAKNPGLS